MKKVTIFATVLALCGVTGLASAADGDMGIDVGVSYVSHYIWRGIDRLDDKAAIQPSVNFDFGNGWHAGVWMSYAGSAGDLRGTQANSAVNATEYNYIVGYGDSTCLGESWQTDYSINWMYYDFIDEPSKLRDAQEINATFAWPNIIGGGWTPSYTIIKMWNSQSGSEYRDISGWIHVVGLDYDWVLSGSSPDNPEQVVTLYADATFNDGAGGVQLDNNRNVIGGVDHDWSHITYGAAAPMKYGEGVFTPFIAYQVSMEKTVNGEDEFYGGVSYSLSF